MQKNLNVGAQRSKVVHRELRIDIESNFWPIVSNNEYFDACTSYLS